MSDLALFSSVVEQQGQNLTSIPAHLLAADNHNVGNDGFSWFSPSSWYDAVTNLPRFTAVSALSGANSFYNTGVAVANWFGAEKEYKDTANWISEIDDNLGEYYSENRQAADLVGFVAGSFIPGLAGMKVLGAGQKALMAAKDSGRIGGAFGQSIGLLTPNPTYWTQQSIRQITTAQTTFSSINANTLRAMASGFGEATLQSAAFEVAVVATMFKSPVLDDMDLGDLTKNVFYGAALGGAIGGVFSVAKTFGAIRKNVTAIDEIEKAYTFRPELGEGMAPADKIVTWLDTLKNSPPPEMGAQVAAARIGQNDAAAEFTKRFLQQAESRDKAIWNAVRTELGTMAKGDQILAESIFNTLKGMDADQVTKNIFGAVEMGRVGDQLKIIKDIKKAQNASFEFVNSIDQDIQGLIQKALVATNIDRPELFRRAAYAEIKVAPTVNKLQKFMESYEGDQADLLRQYARNAINALKNKDFEEAKRLIENLADKRLSVFSSTENSVAWVKVWGDDAGKVVQERPRAAAISDVEKDVKTFVNNQRFDVKTSVGIDELFKQPTKIEARYIWAQTLTKEQMPDVIKATDFPVLERAYELDLPVNVSALTGETVSLQGEKLLSFIMQSKDEIATAMLNDRIKIKNQIAKATDPKEVKRLEGELNKTYTSDDIAKLTNVRREYLEGEVSNNPLDDVLAYQSYQRKYQEDLIKKGLWSEERGKYELYKLPQWVQIGYKEDLIKGADGNLLRGMALIKAKEKLYFEQVDNVLASPTQFGAYFSQFFKIPETAILQSNRFGAGSGLFSFANGNYGSLAAIMESIGASTNALKNNLRDVARGIIEPSLLKLRGDTEAALELQAVFQRLASTSENYILMPDGSLRAQALVEFEAAVAAGKSAHMRPLQEGASDIIEIANPTTLEVIQNHVRRNGERLLALRERRSLKGQEMSLRDDVVYVPKPNTRDYPYFFFVVDEAVTAEASGRVRMVHAATAKDLEALKNKIPSTYKVVTKGETEEYYKALGQYDWEQTLHNSNMDVNLKRNGVNSQFLPKTDPKAIADDLLNWHLRQEDIAARDMVGLKYQKEFAELERLGEQYTGIELSRYGYDRKFAENIVKNPYVNYIKTALDISKINEYPILSTINRTVDRAVSEAFRAVGSVFAKTQSTAELEQVNSAFERYGLKTAFADVDTLIAANHTAPRGALTKFVRDANAILATTILRLDPLNAVNNAVGAQVMLGAETKSILRAIQAADPAKAGKLAELMNIPVLGTQGVNIKSAGKLISNAYKNYFEALQKPEILNLYKELGYVTDLTNQYHRMLDDLTLRGTEKVQDLNDRIHRAYAVAKKIGDVGEKWTANSLAEEMNRFVAANVMKQITDVAIDAGIMSADESIAYIRTFVNRTQGNILASQRPMLFQGPIGQAVGLFQTYQFNLIQQLLRYVGEGTAKDAAMLLGLQGTIYGLNGLPAFSFINQHLVGTASGNKTHSDLYTATYGVFGNNIADMLMYGLPSNMLETNLFTRGDINPRHPTIIPVNPLDVPIVSVLGKFIGSMKEATSKMANGGDVWQAYLQGIEHSGLNRPLSGLAQVLRGLETGEVFATSTRGNVLSPAAHDVFSWGTVTRLLGGKPFDEARLIDTMHRFLAYTAYDRNRRVALGETFKTITVNGEMPNPEQIENFAVAYTERGGDIRNFNRWMMEQIKNSRESQINRIADNLKSPLSQHMQLLMGGAYLEGRTE